MTDEIRVPVSDEEATNVVGLKEALQKLLKEKKKGFGLASIRRISLMTLGGGVDLEIDVSRRLSLCADGDNARERIRVVLGR